VVGRQQYQQCTVDKRGARSAVEQDDESVGHCMQYLWVHWESLGRLPDTLGALLNESKHCSMLLSLFPTSATSQIERLGGRALGG
jgi:hypothetical protein